MWFVCQSFEEDNSGNTSCTLNYLSTFLYFVVNHDHTIIIVSLPKLDVVNFKIPCFSVSFIIHVHLKQIYITTFKLFDFPIFGLWVYLIKVILETYHSKLDIYIYINYIQFILMEFCLFGEIWSIKYKNLSKEEEHSVNSMVND